MLNEDFELNQAREADDITYRNISVHLTYDDGWKKRQRETKTIGRSHFVDRSNLNVKDKYTTAMIGSEGSE